MLGPDGDGPAAQRVRVYRKTASAAKALSTSTFATLEARGAAAVVAPSDWLTAVAATAAD